MATLSMHCICIYLSIHHISLSIYPSGFTLLQYFK